jgi:hypothetical protein
MVTVLKKKKFVKAKCRPIFYRKGLQVKEFFQSNNSLIRNLKIISHRFFDKYVA